MPPATAATAFTAFDALQTRIPQSILTAGGGGFDALQQSLAALPIAKGGLGISTSTSLLPWAYLTSFRYCALVPKFDAAFLEDPDFVRGKVQAELSKPLGQRPYRELIDEPARSDRERAVLHSITQPGASDSRR